MTDEQIKTYIRALEVERRNPKADHAAIDAELARVSPDRSVPRKRAQTRPRTGKQTQTREG